jgi:DNA-binding transcriptional ArsR family regulator
MALTASGPDRADEVLRALAEPRRRAILRLVADDEMSAGEIAAAFEVTRPAVSQHLTVLKNAGLVSERRDGTRRLYRGDPAGLREVRDLLDKLWSSSLSVARRLAEAEADGAQHREAR